MNWLTNPSLRRRFLPPSPRFLAAAGLILLELVYLFLTTRNLDFPAQIIDGIGEYFKQLKIVINFKALPFADFRLPTAAAGYHGLLIGYLFLPLLSLFGPSWTLLRLWPIAVGTVTLLLTYLFAEEFFSRRVAFLAALLLLIHPPYIYGTKVGTSVTGSPMLLFTTGCLLFLARWERTREFRHLAFAMLFLGLGMSTRLWFLWFPVALAGSVLLFWKPWSAPFRTEGAKGRRTLLAGEAALLAGSSGLLFAEFRNDHQFSTTVASALFGAGNPYGLRHYLPNLRFTLGEFHRLLSSRWYFDCYFSFKSVPVPPPCDPVYPAVFWTAALVAAGLAAARRPSGWKTGWFLTLFLLMLLQTPVGLYDHRVESYHLFILYPFVPILLAVAFSGLYGVFPRRAFRSVLVAGLGALLWKETRVMAAFARYAETNADNSLYQLVDWLKAGGAAGKTVVVTNGAHHRALYYLLPEKLLTDDYLLLPSGKGGDCAALKKYFALTGPVEFLFVCPAPFDDSFRKRAARDALPTRLFKEFDTPAGDPSFSLYTASCVD